MQKTRLGNPLADGVGQPAYIQVALASPPLDIAGGGPFHPK